MYRRNLMKLKLSLTSILVCLLAGCAAPQPSTPPSAPSGFPAGKWIDLSYDFSDQTIYWVTAEPFKRTTVAEGKTKGGYYYSAYNFSGAEHGGTHIDAPVHFAEGKKTVDQFEVAELTGPAFKIDVSANAGANRDYLISVEDLQKWEAANGALPAGAIVLLQTGYGKFWPDKKAYLGTDRTGPDAVAELHFPGLDPAAANWLVKERKIKAVGIDTASIDRGQSTDFQSHVNLMTNNVPAFENVANLDQLPVKGATVIALPMKIKGGSGAPLRIIAFVPDAR